MEIQPEDGDALIVVDIQNDFMPSGSLGVPRADEVIAPVNAPCPPIPRASFSRRTGIPPDTPRLHRRMAASPSRRSSLPTVPQMLWPDHCIQGTEGAEFWLELDQRPAELILRKGFCPGVDSYSAFYENDRSTRTGLTAYLHERGVRRVVICGLALDVLRQVDGAGCPTRGIRGRRGRGMRAARRPREFAGCHVQGLRGRRRQARGLTAMICLFFRRAAMAAFTAVMLVTAAAAQEFALPDADALAAMTPTERQALAGNLIRQAQNWPRAEARERIPSPDPMVEPLVQRRGTLRGVHPQYAAAGAVQAIRVEEHNYIRIEDLDVGVAPSLHVMLVSKRDPAAFGRAGRGDRPGAVACSRRQPHVRNAGTAAAVSARWRSSACSWRWCWRWRLCGSRADRLLGAFERARYRHVARTLRTPTAEAARRHRPPLVHGRTRRCTCGRGSSLRRFPQELDGSTLSAPAQCHAAN